MHLGIIHEQILDAQFMNCITVSRMPIPKKIAPRFTARGIILKTINNTTFNYLVNKMESTLTVPESAACPADLVCQSSSNVPLFLS